MATFQIEVRRTFCSFIYGNTQKWTSYCNLGNSSYSQKDLHLSSPETTFLIFVALVLKPKTIWNNLLSQFFSQHFHTLLEPSMAKMKQSWNIWLIVCIWNQNRQKIADSRWLGPIRFRSSKQRRKRYNLKLTFFLAHRPKKLRCGRSSIFSQSPARPMGAKPGCAWALENFCWDCFEPKFWSNKNKNTPDRAF